MKQLTTIVALFFAVIANAQNAKDTIINDSTPVITKRQIEAARQRIFEKLEPLEAQLNAAKYNGIVEGVSAIYAELIAIWSEEYNKKRKPKK